MITYLNLELDKAKVKPKIISRTFLAIFSGYLIAEDENTDFDEQN
jgi:hypothetical protein